jgi:hypothetical protein
MNEILEFYKNEWLKYFKVCDALMKARTGRNM